MLFLNLSAAALSKTQTVCGLSLANAEFRWQLTMLFYRIAGNARCFSTARTLRVRKLYYYKDFIRNSYADAWMDRLVQARPNRKGLFGNSATSR